MREDDWTYLVVPGVVKLLLYYFSDVIDVHDWKPRRARVLG